jgi:tetratricopeptide (TPR) repeat protein/predicted Ser/Thr protein kinase
VSHPTGDRSERAPATHADGIADADRGPETARRARVASDEVLAPGTVIARFIVHRVLGVGGAGIVYAAHDPELDRTTALKVLRRELAERIDARARFLREAQALARLSHPNVISVYDVGAAGGCTFIAMEHIRGRTFADWVAASPRSWREIVAVLVKAGRGLAAAHAAGLIHRDFKPANLLVGDDGRVVVTDFGLARATEGTREEVPEAAGSGADPLAASITRTGIVQGTPAYMAPEQADGRSADARADQFSFCVTLYEALFGAHPFLPPSSSAGASGPSFAFAAAPESAREPSTARLPSDGRGVPVWLQRTALRGLSERPDDRYPSMDSLLAVLNHEPLSRRRRMQRAIAAVGVVIAGAGITAYAVSGDRSLALCGGAADRVAAIWNVGSRAEMRSALAATGLPYAPDTWRRVEPVLQAYAAQWGAMHTEACRATRILGEQSDLLMDRRMACLDVRLRELDQLTRLLRKPDPDVVEHAITAARGLSSIQACGDLAALTRSVAPPPDPVTAARVGEVRQKLAEARVLHDAGKYPDGVAIVDKLASESVARDYLPLRAELSYTAGRLRGARSEWERAASHLDDALWAAEASGHDEIVIAALSSAVSVLAERDQFREAGDLIHRGEAALLRMSAPPLVRAEFRTNVCQELDRAGRFAEAHEQCQQALDLRRRELGPDHPDVAISLYRLGLRSGSYEHSEPTQQGLSYLREALAIEERALGSEHPELQRTLTAMADTEVRLDRFDDALAHCRRALVIAERALGPETMRVFAVLISLGNVLRLRHQDAESVGVFRRALAIAEHEVGPEHSQAALAHMHLGNVLQAKPDYEAALQQFRRAASIFEATVGTDHPNYAITLLDICSMQFELERPREALPYCTRGLTALERVLGREAPAVADALVGMLDRVYAANGMIGDALAALDRGIASWRKDDPTAPAKIAEGELTLAQTIWKHSRPDRARARALAIRARDRLRDAGAGSEARRKDADAWLASHGGRGSDPR